MLVPSLRQPAEAFWIADTEGINLMRCDKLRATITAATCIKFQKANKTEKKKGQFLVPYSSCLDCEQGKEIRKEKGIDHDMDVEQLKAIHQGQQVKKPFAMQDVAKPQKRAYNKRSVLSQIEGPVITDPLSAFEDTDPELEEQPIVAENALTEFKPCRHHPDQPQVIGNNGISTGFCRECLAQRARKSSAVRKANKAAGIVPVPKRLKLTTSQAIVDFQGFPELFDFLKNNAKENLRTLGNEIIFHILRATNDILP
jgi:hypothetical protein